MSAGTLTLTNNSAAVAGSRTAFTTELAAGDFIVVTVSGIPYTLPVKTVNSNTSLILVSNFTGPTQSGLAWSAVPRLALNMVTAALVAQSAEALRGLNYDKQNWQQFFTADGDVTITLPNTSQTTGPSAKKLITITSGKAEKGANSDITSLSGLTTALSIKQGGTGAKNASDALANLGLPNLFSQKANLNGDANVDFYVRNNGSATAAVNNDRLNYVLGGYAYKGGDASQGFAVAGGSSPNSAVAYNQFQSGSNGNGAWVKMPGGGQWCRQNLNIPANSIITWTFPAAFGSTPALLFSTFNGAPNIWFNGASASGANLFNSNSSAINVNVLAIW